MRPDAAGRRGDDSRSPRLGPHGANPGSPGRPRITPLLSIEVDRHVAPSPDRPRKTSGSTQNGPSESASKRAAAYTVAGGVAASPQQDPEMALLRSVHSGGLVIQPQPPRRSRSGLLAGRAQRTSSKGTSTVDREDLNSTAEIGLRSPPGSGSPAWYAQQKALHAQMTQPMGWFSAQLLNYPQAPQQGPRSGPPASRAEDASFPRMDTDASDSDDEHMQVTSVEVPQVPNPRAGSLKSLRSMGMTSCLSGRHPGPPNHVLEELRHQQVMQSLRELTKQVGLLAQGLQGKCGACAQPPGAASEAQVEHDGPAVQSPALPLAVQHSSSTHPAAVTMSSTSRVQVRSPSESDLAPPAASRRPPTLAAPHVPVLSVTTGSPLHPHDGANGSGAPAETAPPRPPMPGSASRPSLGSRPSMAMLPQIPRSPRRDSRPSAGDASPRSSRAEASLMPGGHISSQRNVSANSWRSPSVTSSRTEDFDSAGRQPPSPTWGSLLQRAPQSVTSTACRMLSRVLDKVLLPIGTTAYDEDPDVVWAVRRIKQDGAGASCDQPRRRDVRAASNRRSIDDDLPMQRRQRILMPDCRFRILWDCIYLICVLYQTVVFTLAMAVWGGTSLGMPPIRYPLHFAVSLFWFVDLFVQLRTCRLVGHEMIDDPDELRQRFMRGRLWFDLLMAPPYSAVASLLGAPAEAAWAAGGIHLLRLKHVLWRDLFQLSSPILETPIWADAIEMMSWTVIFVHTAACIWLGVATEEDWQGFAGATTNRTYWDVYSTAIYFTVTTTTSVGYGDISPVSESGRWYNMAMQVAGVVVIMLIGGRTGAYFVLTDPFKLMALERRRRLSSLMTKEKIPWSIQREAFTIYPVILEAGMLDYQEGLQELPDFVAERISRHIKLRLLSHVPLFSDVSKTVLTHLAESLHEYAEIGREYIIRAGDPGKEMYFLTHGVVEVLLPAEGADGVPEEVWTANLKAGSWFGEIALLQETTRVASVRTLTPCALYRLDKPDFDWVVAGSAELRRAIQKETQRRLTHSKKIQQETQGDSPESSAAKMRRASVRAARPSFSTTPGSPASPLRGEERRPSMLQGAGERRATIGGRSAGGFMPRVKATREQRRSSAGSGDSSQKPGDDGSPQSTPPEPPVGAHRSPRTPPVAS